MTLEPYSPDKMDQMSLRMFDVCARVRAMAQRCREHELEGFPLHDKKALEWLVKLEDWAQKIDRDLEMSIIRQRGSKRATSSTGK